jgi:F0F1-type ATP synthase assembly protein I
MVTQYSLPVGLLGLAAIAACWAFAVTLYRVGAPGSVARKLSLLLFVEGVTLATAGFPEMAFGVGQDFWEQHPVYAMVNFFGHTAGDAAMLALYPPFLAAALKTRLTRPFGSKRAQIILWVLAVALVPAVMLSPLRIGATLLYGSLSLLFGFALIASLHAWYKAKTANAATARSFAIAFGIRDVCWGFVYASSIAMVWTDTYMYELNEFSLLVKVIYALGTLLAVPLIAYGILRTQLFDIDLRVQWTIKQSTLATIIVTLVFLISEGADRLLSAELGNWAGLLAAAVIVFFLTPLQRFAENVASAAMPNTRNTPEYTAYRKMQVYEEAVSEAHYEGGISDKERALLVRLRDSLGIAESDAMAIESDILERSTAAG